MHTRRNDLQLESWIMPDFGHNPAQKPVLCSEYRNDAYLPSSQELILDALLGILRDVFPGLGNGKVHSRKILVHWEMMHQSQDWPGHDPFCVRCI